MTTLDEAQTEDLQQLLIALDETPWPPLEKALSSNGIANPEGVIQRLRDAVGLS